MKFGKRLREARIQKHLTQQALADKVKVELRTYQRYEQGSREPSFAMLCALADALEVSTDYLLERNENN